LGEFIEQCVLGVMGGPKGEVIIPGDAALGGFPEEPGVGVLGEFVEADIAPIDRHGLRVGGEGDDARAVVELDHPTLTSSVKRGRRHPSGDSPRGFPAGW
jgi:hypothetical protein